MRTKTLILCVVFFLSVSFSFGQRKTKQKIVQGKICGNPNVKCKTRDEVFTDSDIQFELPEDYVIYESEPFYAIILRSSKVSDLFGGEETCKAAATETERSEIQKLFPNNKVFTQNCGYGAIIYEANAVFLAVFAGRNLTPAKSFLDTVLKTGKFEGAYIKKLQASLNGT